MSPFYVPFSMYTSVSGLKPSLLFFCSDFEKVLTQLHWPIISPPTQSLTPAANYQEISSQLDVLVTQLLALQTSYPSAWNSAPRSLKYVHQNCSQCRMGYIMYHKLQDNQMKISVK